MSSPALSDPLLGKEGECEEQGRQGRGRQGKLEVLLDQETKKGITQESSNSKKMDSGPQPKSLRDSLPGWSLCGPNILNSIPGITPSNSTGALMTSGSLLPSWISHDLSCYSGGRASTRRVSEAVSAATEAVSLATRIYLPGATTRNTLRYREGSGAVLHKDDPFGLRRQATYRRNLLMPMGSPAWSPNVRNPAFSMIGDNTSTSHAWEGWSPNEFLLNGDVGGESGLTVSRIDRGVRWVLCHMLPTHIHVSSGKIDNSVSIVLDQRLRTLIPVGFIPVESKRTIVDEVATPRSLKREAKSTESRSGDCPVSNAKLGDSKIPMIPGDQLSNFLKGVANSAPAKARSPDIKSGDTRSTDTTRPRSTILTQSEETESSPRNARNPTETGFDLAGKTVEVVYPSRGFLPRTDECTRSKDGESGRLICDLTPKGTTRKEDSLQGKDLSPRKGRAVEVLKQGSEIRSDGRSLDQTGSSLRVEIIESAKPLYKRFYEPVPGKALSVGVRGWQRNEDEMEGLIFIHGYKTPLNEAPLLLGQLIALGGFPNHIKPFMFLWPAGTKVWHYNQARRASEHRHCQRALVVFLRSLARQKIRTVHIMAHSMGSRLFLKSLQHAFDENLFMANQRSGALPGVGGLLKLSNLIFIHPEAYLDEFVHSGEYDALHEISENITIYCHSNDEALMSAEIISRGRRCMGRHPFGYVRRAIKSSTPSSASRSHSSGRLSTSASATPIRSGRDSTKFGSSRDFLAARSLEPPAKCDRPEDGQSRMDGLEWLDVDVIDCTYLDANVHNLRHCFFNINASVVGDLREVLVNRSRASRRVQTLEQRQGNVYSFRVPPSRLNSIFGL